MTNFELQYEEAQRLQELPTYVFAKLDELKRIQRAKGVDLIDLGMGNPDLPVPEAVINSTKNAINSPPNLRYPEFRGTNEFRQAVTTWCKKQYDIDIDTDTEVMPLIGSKEGVVHLIFALVNPGDVTITPMPAYPAHFRATILAGGIPKDLPVDENNQPQFDQIPEDILEKTKIIILSYPTNPTAITATKSTFEKAVAFCKKHNKILFHDFAYAEIYYDGQKPLSMLSIPGAKDVCIEFHTCSKSFSMAGFRIGFAVGNPKLIASLSKMKSNLDYGLFMVNQEAAIEALKLNDQDLNETRKIYQDRRDLMLAGLKELGCHIDKPTATMYLWAPVPHGFDATGFSMKLIEECGVVVSPGTAFGDEGQGYIRIALVEPQERIKEALERLKAANIHWAEGET